MATDFIRIGGPIESAPLNTNFRRLRNDISIANVNLAFSDTDGIKNNVKDMLNIENPANAQTCYVVSNGSLYRYAKYDNQWHKIADFGQTYRQGFLNSGVVVMADLMSLKVGVQNTLLIPEMLVYYKTLPGDEVYLKGMYRVEGQDLDLNTKLTPGTTYTIALDNNRRATYITGVPKYDNPNIIVIGTIATDSNGNILEDFICTTPNIAYTADRGNFITHGGEINGLDFGPNGGKYISRREGIYHYEGINVIIAEVENYPLELDNGSNHNIRSFKAQPSDKMIYMYPEDTLNNPVIEERDTLIINQWYDKDTGTLKTLEKGQYTIQRHFILPNGKNIVLYGDADYNSFDDAESHLNDDQTVDFQFPCVEATRMIIGNVDNFNTNTSTHFKTYTLTRLAQAGTIDPEFADDEFIIYDGNNKRSSPTNIRFDLTEIENVNETYVLRPQAYDEKDFLFGLTSKYVYDNVADSVPMYDETARNVLDNNSKGYIIPTQRSVNNIQNRLNEIETEIWKSKQTNAKTYEQGIRYRLEDSEKGIDALESRATSLQEQINNILKTRVYKLTTINNHPLGKELNNPEEINSVVLVTGDIKEGVSSNDQTLNRWFTEERVLEMPEIEAAFGHSQITNQNPHKTTTDQIIEGTKKFVSEDDKNKISNLPNNTQAELDKKMEGLLIKTIGGNSNQATPGAVVDWGDIQTLRLYTDGIKLHVDTVEQTATLECIGQADPSDFLKKSQYAPTSMSNSNYNGYVDKAITAQDIESLKDLEGQQTKYYGTNDEGIIGTYDLPVTTGDVKGSASVEDVAFEPYKHSITLKHLANASVIYTENNEESTLNTNVYDLVKNRYHKVYNSGVQEEYGANGEFLPHEIYYNHIAAFGGITERAHFFTHNNNCYSFIPTEFISAGTELRFYPESNRLVYIKNGVENTLTYTSIEGSKVDDEYLLHFVSSTDWNCVNEWNFGDNLAVSVVNGRATINVKNPVNATYENHFANLSDVNVEYNDLNLGKLLMLAKDADNNYMIRLQEVPLQEYMKLEDYVENYVYDGINHIVNHANLANQANTASTLQGLYTVDNTARDDSHLWSAQKIATYVDAKVNNIHKIHYDVGSPAYELGDDGDIYIMLED